MVTQIYLPDLFQISSLSMIEMFVVAFAQNDVVLDDDILGRRKISFQPFEKQRNKSISFYFKRI